MVILPTSRKMIYLTQMSKLQNDISHTNEQAAKWLYHTQMSKSQNDISHTTEQAAK